MRFTVTDEVRRLGVHGAYVVLEDIDNGRTPEALERPLHALAARLDAELTPEFIATDPVLAGFRELHDAVGRSNRRFPSSAEGLVALFQRKRRLPRINPFVDLYNAVSLETRLSLGAHDLAKLEGGVTLKIATGDERFVPLGGSLPEPIHAGEYVYVDDADEVVCRLEHRQCEKTRVDAATRACFCIVQGHRGTSADDLRSALERLCSLAGALLGARRSQVWVA
jgi:DNA/RNA-binding domain of Phe-tRNA-synthetase-like protein